MSLHCIKGKVCPFVTSFWFCPQPLCTASYCLLPSPRHLSVISVLNFLWERSLCHGVCCIFCWQYFPLVAHMLTFSWVVNHVFKAS
jgi:hypothetical protein